MDLVPSPGPEKITVPEKLYTKNRKEKAKEKLKAQDDLKDLQVESGKSDHTPATSKTLHQHKKSPTPPKAINYIPTYGEPPSPSTLAANIIKDIIAKPPTDKKPTVHKNVEFNKRVQDIPKYTLGKL